MATGAGTQGGVFERRKFNLMLFRIAYQVNFFGVFFQGRSKEKGGRCQRSTKKTDRHIVFE
jgi:hypothetical protein